MWDRGGKTLWIDFDLFAFKLKNKVKLVSIVGGKVVDIVSKTVNVLIVKEWRKRSSGKRKRSMQMIWLRSRSPNISLKLLRNLQLVLTGVSMLKFCFSHVLSDPWVPLLCCFWKVEFSVLLLLSSVAPYINSCTWLMLLSAQRLKLKVLQGTERRQTNCQYERRWLYFSVLENEILALAVREKVYQAC